MGAAKQHFTTGVSDLCPKRSSTSYHSRKLEESHQFLVPSGSLY